jgi:hypothetical protein
MLLRMQWKKRRIKSFYLVFFVKIKNINNYNIKFRVIIRINIKIIKNV